MKKLIYSFLVVVVLTVFFSSCKKQIKEMEPSVAQKAAVDGKLSAATKKRNIITVKTGTTRLTATKGTGSDYLYIDSLQFDGKRILDISFAASGGGRVYSKWIAPSATGVYALIPCEATTGYLELEEFGAYASDGSENVIIHRTSTFTIEDADPYISATGAYKPFDSASPGATLTIYGGRFGLDTSKVKVTFPGGVSAKVLRAECSSVTVEVPSPKPGGPTSGTISLAMVGRTRVAVGPTFTFKTSLPNPYKTFVAITWPRKYDGSAAPTINPKAYCVAQETGAMYIWDAGTDPLKEGRILEYKPGTAGFVNLLNTASLYWPNISDMDISMDGSKLYISETGYGAIWVVDLTKIKTDSANAIGQIATNGNMYRRSIKMYPAAPTDIWGACIFSQSDAGGGTDFRYTSFVGTTTFGLNQKMWYRNVKNIVDPMGVDLLASPYGGYDAYVTDMSAGKVYAGPMTGSDYTSTFAAGLNMPKDIAISNIKNSSAGIVAIACQDGVRVYDKIGTYKYTLKLFNRYDGKTYSPDFVAIGKSDKHIYAGAYNTGVIFDFYDL